MNAFSEITLELSKTARNNGSLQIHTLIIPNRPGKDLFTLNEFIKLPDITYLKFPLTKYAIPTSASFNLLKEESKKQSIKPITHIKSKYAIVMCTEEFELSNTNIPPEIIRHIRINSKRQFLPIVVQDVMQIRLRDLKEITPDMKKTTFTFIYSPATVGKMKFMTQIEGTLHQFVALGFTEKDFDEVKGVFADTNFYLLCATILIGSIHVCLDFFIIMSILFFF